LGPHSIAARTSVCRIANVSAVAFEHHFKTRSGTEEYKHGNPRHPSLHPDSPRGRIWRDPRLGFGTLIPDPLATKQATKTALEVGFRHFDCAERYRNEQVVGNAMQEVIKAGTIQRKDIFVTTKLWNNHSSRAATQ
jgi:hypothetical protein